MRFFIFLAFLLTALGALLMFVARTGPEEASSNLSKWAIWIGIRPPTWLTDKSVDHKAKRLAATLLILALVSFCAWIYTNAQAQNPIPPTASPISPPPTVNQGPGSAFSYGQQGGVTAGTVNVGPVPRR